MDQEEKKRMGIVTSQGEIPAACCYVCTNDRFMSNWGPASGKTNTLIFCCASYEEAEIVAQNARARKDQKNVRICSGKPKLRAGVLYQVKTREEYPRWYKPNQEW